MWKTFTLVYLVWCGSFTIFDFIIGSGWFLLQALFLCLATFWFWEEWIKN